MVEIPKNAKNLKIAKEHWKIKINGCKENYKNQMHKSDLFDKCKKIRQKLYGMDSK